MEAMILELVLDFLEAEAVGDGSEDIEGGLTDPSPLIGRERIEGF